MQTKLCETPQKTTEFHVVVVVVIDSISADIKLETENEEGICSEDAPTCLSDNVYHPRVALKNAINEW